MPPYCFSKVIQVFWSLKMSSCSEKHHWRHTFNLTVAPEITVGFMCSRTPHHLKLTQGRVKAELTLSAGLCLHATWSLVPAADTRTPDLSSSWSCRYHEHLFVYLTLQWTVRLKTWRQWCFSKQLVMSRLQATLITSDGQYGGILWIICVFF